MKRREFLMGALSAGMLFGLGATPPFLPSARASGFAASTQRVLVHLMLSGGPDFRHLFPPAFSAATDSFGYHHWSARASSHAIEDNPQACATRWNQDYYPVGYGAVEFGILKSCGWLKRMWDAGQVAIVSNVLVGTKPDHSLATLKMDQADPNAGIFDIQRAGWGGKLAVAAGGKVVALTPNPRPFCFGPHPTDPSNHDNACLISASNTRAMGLYRPPPDARPLATNSVISRSLNAYYRAKHLQASPDSVYDRFMAHEQILRQLGVMVDERLGSLPVPASIQALVNSGLTRPGFAEQIRNLYDAFACADLMELSVASMECNGFDTHKNQRASVEPLFIDLFGDGKALDVLYGELPEDVLDNTVLAIGGEFGRRLRANGDAGTDHGEGNSMLLIGRRVRGGVYGEMFPDSEIARIDARASAIEGRTGADRLAARICDWVAPGSSGLVFPQGFVSPLENGLDLGAVLI